MSVTARTFILAVSALFVLGGIAVTWTQGGGWALIVVGVVLALSVLLEGRYRGARDGGPRDSGPAQWQRTGEREVDSETGEIIEVWFDPQTGRRRYEPIGTFPPA